jgi:hypothetical protein
MFNSSKPAVALSLYVVAFGLAFFSFLHGFRVIALASVVLVWALLALWVRKGGW